MSLNRLASIHVDTLDAFLFLWCRWLGGGGGGGGEYEMTLFKMI